ncbi:MAG: hypothetical protein M9939_05245 [Mesorhizobium sp.]|nr:colicin E5-related ribonuclease [Mesorhizobium sp.]MCO5160518.1 hypothetical protein [Mesorhizobium sp.]
MFAPTQVAPGTCDGGACNPMVSSTNGPAGPASPDTSGLSATPPDPEDDNKDKEKEPGWTFGSHKTDAKWANQMEQRGWTKAQIDEALQNTKSRVPAVNNVNPQNAASRYSHPTTQKSVVIDDVTKQILHVGKEGYKY